MDKITPVFTATATAIGGRSGHAESSDGVVKVEFSVPKALGGPGKAGTATPEHLLAAGYAACFGGSLDVVAKRQNMDASRVKVTAAVSLGPRSDGGLGLAVKMRVEDMTLPHEVLAPLVQQVHETACPFSLGIRGNVDVQFEIVAA